jgi:hypothetical protein
VGAGVSLASLSPLRADASSPDLRSGEPERLLDEIERRACRYFFGMADPDTGLVLDRSGVHVPYSPGVSSIAATGFGLSALCIGDMRGYLDRDAARNRVRRTLDFLNKKAEQVRGFYYHFVNSATGERAWHSEASTIDTAWLLCGALHCREYWSDPDIRRMAGDLLDRAEWKWMLNRFETISHGWTPERGFLPYRWDAYAESLAMYLLAIGSNTSSIPASSWNAVRRPIRDFEGIFYIDASTPLFVHQYSHAWFDFRNRVDRFANYFHNSQRATQAHRLYCMTLSTRFPWYGPDMWGITASDSRNGYRVWNDPGCPPDGTLVPCAAGGSVVFLPDLCTAVLQNMLDRYGENVWSQYGFVDAFQPNAGWFSPYVIGINLGIMLLMAENARSGEVWGAVMSATESKRAMDLVGLRATA